MGIREMAAEKRMKTAKAKKLLQGIALAREDWDFGKCQKGREEFCYHYEYAREVKWIVDDYLEMQRYRVKATVEQPSGFDDFGNWHFHVCGDSEMHDDWGLSLQLAPGFPDVPYLKTKHRPYEIPRPA